MMTVSNCPVVFWIQMSIFWNQSAVIVASGKACVRDSDCLAFLWHSAVLSLPLVVKSLHPPANTALSVFSGTTCMKECVWAAIAVCVFVGGWRRDSQTTRGRGKCFRSLAWIIHRPLRSFVAAVLMFLAIKVESCAYCSHTWKARRAASELQCSTSRTGR